VGGEKASETIEDLARRGAIADARHLLEQLPLRRTLRADALDALRRILARATPGELLQFESEGRSEYGWWFHWHGVDLRDLTKMPAAIRMLATFHPSGYVREDAVKSLAGEDDALPYLLLRLNDWVEPVARSARQAVEACLARASAAAVVHCLPIVERLRSMRRRDLHAVVDSIERSLARPSALPAVREAFASAPPLVRRASVLYASRQPSENSVPLLVELTADQDAVVASRATEALVRVLPPSALQANVGPLLRSRVGKVRLLSLSALVASGSQDLDGVLRRGTLDATAAVRELARYELARRGPIDFVTSYAGALRSGNLATLVPALCGLRECGTKADASHVAPLLSHRSVRVRAAAVRALGKLDPDAYACALARSLEDPSPRVVRVASEALRGRSYHLDKSQLRWLLKAGTPRTATAALDLLCEEGYWAGLEVALGAAGLEEAAVRAAAIAKLEKLLGQQVYARPPNLDAIKAAFEATKEHLPLHLRRRLEGSVAAAHRMS
jgi:HEAT repeat protein